MGVRREKTAGMKSVRRDGPRESDTPILSRVLGLAFGGCLVGIAMATVLGFPSDPSEGEEFRAGREAFELGRIEEARDHFLAEIQNAESIFASATYHNLGLISLQESLAENVPDPLAAAQDAIRYMERSLALEPGAEGTAWNLELALRQLTKLTSARGPDPDPTPEQQPAASSADTRSEGNQESEGNTEGGRETDPNLSVDAARRLLASFRLMEKSSSREALRSLLISGSRTTSLGRRGPPW